MKTIKTYFDKIMSTFIAGLLLATCVGVYTMNIKQTKNIEQLAFIKNTLTVRDIRDNQFRARIQQEVDDTRAVVIKKSEDLCLVELRVDMLEKNIRASNFTH